MVAEVNADFNLRGRDRSKRAFATLNQSLRNTARSLQVIQGPLGPLAGRFTALSGALGTLNPALLGASAALAGFALAGNKAIDTFTRTQSRMLQLEAQLKATGNAAGFTSRELEDMAQNLARATLASLDEVRQAQGILISFRSISEDSFSRALAAAQNLAAAGFGSMRTAAVQLGKALEDPRQGLDGLARSGTKFTQGQKDVIAAMVDSGNKAGALRAILDEVEKQVGGAGEGAGAGLAGSFDSLAQSVENFWAALGESLAGDIFKGTLEGIASAIQSLAEAIGGFESMTTQALEERLKGINDQLDRLSGRGRGQAALADLKNQRMEIEAILKRRREEAAEADRARAKTQSALAAQAANERTIALEKAAQARLDKDAEKAREKAAKNFESLKRQLDQSYAITQKWAEQIEVIRMGTQGDADERRRLNELAESAATKQLKALQKLSATMSAVKDISVGAGEALLTGITDALIEAKNLKSALNDVLRQIARLAVQRLIVDSAVNAISRSFAPPIGAPTTSAPAQIGGYRSGLTMVGERGVELVNLPPGSRVIPNHKLGGGDTSIVINNNALPPESVQVDEQSDGTVLVNLVRNIVDDEINGGGRTGTSMRTNYGLRKAGVTR